MASESGTDLYLLIFSGTALMLLLAFVIILFVYLYQKKLYQQQSTLQLIENNTQNALLTASLEAEERERERIAMNLHDEIGASLNLLKLNLNQIALENKNSRAGKEISEQINFLDSTIDLLRNINKELLPPSLGNMGIIIALQELFEVIKQKQSIRFDLKTENFQQDKICPKMELHLFRIIKELTNNAIKHSLSKHIRVKFIMVQQSLMVNFNYDGSGLAQHEFEKKLLQSGGQGLKNIQNRINFLNGSIFFNKIDDQNSLIRIEIPLNEKDN